MAHDDKEYNHDGKEYNGSQQKRMKKLILNNVIVTN